MVPTPELGDAPRFIENWVGLPRNALGFSGCGSRPCGREPPTGGGGGTAHPRLSPRAGLCLHPGAQVSVRMRSVLSR